MIEPTDIATVVKRARASKGWSQPELARRVGTSQQTIDQALMRLKEFAASFN